MPQSSRKTSQSLRIQLNRKGRLFSHRGKRIRRGGMQLIDEFIINKVDIKDSDEYIFDNLRKRCYELIDKHPEKRQLFDNYIKKQEEENDVLENKVVCSTMVIKKIA